MPPSTKPARGAPLGNINALKHGFYTRRLKKGDLSGVETTGEKNLIDEIAIVRVFSRRLIESLDPEADSAEIATALRILCIALTAITRAIKTQRWLGLNDTSVQDDIATAIRQVWEETRGRYLKSPDHPSGTSTVSSPGSSSSPAASTCAPDDLPPTGGPSGLPPPHLDLFRFVFYRETNPLHALFPWLSAR